jgi:hypothetical protein
MFVRIHMGCVPPPGLTYVTSGFCDPSPPPPLPHPLASAAGYPPSAHLLRGPLVVEPRSGALVLNGVPGTGTLQVYDPVLRVHVADIDVRITTPPGRWSSHTITQPSPPMSPLVTARSPTHTPPHTHPNTLLYYSHP